MPIRPSSFSSKGAFTPNLNNPYLLSDDGSIDDDDSSDFSFEIEEEIVQASSPKRTNRIATVKQQTKYRDVGVPSRNNNLLESLRNDTTSRGAQRSLNNKKVMQQAAITYKAGSARTSSDDDSIISDDDFSISVASETDGLIMSASVVKKTSPPRNVKTSVVEAKQPANSSRRNSIEKSRLITHERRSGNARDDTSTTSSSKTAIQSLMGKLSSIGDTSVSKSSTQNTVERKEQTHERRSGNARDDTSTTSSSKTAIQSLMGKLSSIGDTSVSKSSTQNTVERKELFLGRPSDAATTSSSSSTVPSLKSKAAGSIDYAESIVKSQHHADIEHGASTTSSTSCSSGKLSSRFGGNTAECTLEGQKMAAVAPSSSNKRRSKRRKICCVVGFILVAAGGTVGALIGLDVIFKDAFKAKTTTSPETPEPEPDTTLTTSNIALTWYVDWDAFQCVMDCNGRPPCGGTNTNNAEMYPTLRECCSKGMVDFIDEKWHWTVEHCTEQTAVETLLPTYSPTAAKEEEETAGPTRNPQVSTPFPTAVPEVVYFADFSTKKCIAETTSRRAGWERGYETIRDCCGANFGGDLQKECMGEEEEEADTSSTEQLVKFYPDYGARNCVEGDSTTKASWERGFDTKAECCEVNFIWDQSSICFQGEEEVATDTIASTTTSTTTSTAATVSSSTIASTTASTTVSASTTAFKSSTPTSTPTTGSTSHMPTSSPTKVPTSSPTMKPTTSSPTRAPSSSPTSSPIIIGTPTRSPVVSPSSSPSNFPSYSPTAFPSTVAPTDEPTLNPSGTPTAPTSSPTGELESLRAVLVERSPISSDNLLLEDSAQYRALEWLVGNTMYDSYAHDRKIQRWALVTFYYSLYGSEWVLSDGWTNHEGNLEHECTWHGISCTGSGTVLSIDLKANNIFGHLPDEISLLVDVEYLGLSENKIRSIPASFIDLPKLKVLDMDKNRLQEIPDGDYGSSVLEELYLSNNNIGTIPDVFFELRSVKVLWLANNQISSTLEGFGKMALLQELDLESNLFFGPIPEEMFSLVNLVVLYLYDNELAGQFPPGLSQLASLTELDLHSNHIGGELPSEIGKFPKLSELYLGNNNIAGQIPSQLYDVTSLTVLDISENFLNSTIETELGNLNQLTILDLHDNYNTNNNGKVDSYGIYGSIPDTIGSLSLLTELRLDNNYVQGKLPPAIGDLKSLQVLRLESNNFHGSIKAVGNAINLQYLHLWSNYFNGVISNSIGQLSQVVEIFLDDNEFTGTIPSEIGQLSSAKYISLGLNDLEGAIPPSFGMLSSLERLDLQGNNLSGEIPAEIGNILSLERIRLEGNQFSGDIPKAVCKLDSFISGNCEVTTGADMTETVATETTIENGWSCNCCAVCDEL